MNGVLVVPRSFYGNKWNEELLQFETKSMSYPGSKTGSFDTHAR